MNQCFKNPIPQKDFLGKKLPKQCLCILSFYPHAIIFLQLKFVTVSFSVAIIMIFENVHNSLLFILN